VCKKAKFHKEKFIPVELKICILPTYVKPTFRICSCCLGSLHKKSIDKLESVQIRAARSVMNDFHQTSCSISNMLSFLSWNTIETHFKHLKLHMLHKIIYNSVDVSLPNYIMYKTRYTRSSDLKLIQPDTTINAYNYSFFPAAIQLFEQST